MYASSVTAASLVMTTDFRSSSPYCRIEREAVVVQQREERAAAVPRNLPVLEHLVPHPRRGVQTAGCAQPPALVDVLEFRAMIHGQNESTPPWVGHVGVKPRVTGVDGQGLVDGGRSIAEPAVDAALGRLETGDGEVLTRPWRDGARRTSRVRTPRRRCVGATHTHDTPAIGSTAPPGTVSRRSRWYAMPTRSSPSQATTAPSSGIRVRHMSVASSGRKPPKLMAANRVMAGQSVSAGGTERQRVQCIGHEVEGVTAGV